VTVEVGPTMHFTALLSRTPHRACPPVDRQTNHYFVEAVDRVGPAYLTMFPSRSSDTF
jgi:hypothetical protein